ncbi:hypothetical protein THAOC_05341 [Thalassiosira oceanica]|uniref:Uncharacterized protein n=1 Tax=Thalassiosira oceanica TaxID=159749 RepID=K0THC4_THAOC|nr:hypothetical protein THAOC_05341 [Thalassiosira oceanica]|eukprot:EJK73061.1 hypothetical protein THAOC_05341 [Thalassiosira oceanica]
MWDPPFRHRKRKRKRKRKPRKPSAAGQASSPPPVASAASAAATSARRVSEFPAEVQSLCASPDSCASPDKKKKKHNDQRGTSDCLCPDTSQDLMSRPESLPDGPVLPSSPQGKSSLGPTSPPRPRSSVIPRICSAVGPTRHLMTMDDDEDSDDDDDYDDDSDDDSDYKDAIAAIEEDPIEDIDNDNDNDDPTDFHECIVPPTPASEGSKPRAVPSNYRRRIRREYGESLQTAARQQKEVRLFLVSTPYAKTLPRRISIMPTSSSVSTCS